MVKKNGDTSGGKTNITWENLNMARKGNLKRETESLLIAAQNNAIRTNYVKTKIEEAQEKSSCRLCGDRDETINHIISESSKLTQSEYKAQHLWVGKMIHRELCKKFNFAHTNKKYKHNSESALENEVHKILWDFDIQTDLLISARRPDLITVKNKKANLLNSGLCRSGWPPSKTERKRKQR